jgi:hypothetical protein
MHDSAACLTGGGRRGYKTVHPDEENTSFITQSIHKAIYSYLRYRNVCVIDAIFI